MTRSLFLSCALLTLRVAARTAFSYTDEKSGITFNGYTHSLGFIFDIVVPENPTIDLIAQSIAPVTNNGGWAGATLGSSMVGALIVTACPHKGEAVPSFRKATGYTSPPEVEGEFTMTTILDGTYVNDTVFSYTFLCSNCTGDEAPALSNLPTSLAGHMPLRHSLFCQTVLPR